MSDNPFLQDPGKTHLPTVFSSYQLVCPRLPLHLAGPGSSIPGPTHLGHLAVGVQMWCQEAAPDTERIKVPFCIRPHSLSQLTRSPDLCTQPIPTPAHDRGWSRSWALHTPAYLPLAQVPPALLASVGKPVRFYLKFLSLSSVLKVLSLKLILCPDIYFPFL